MLRRIILKTQLSFLRLGLLIRHEKGAFLKRSSDRLNSKTPALNFRVDGKHFGNETFRKQ